MREILFRGKCVYSGEWVYGHFYESRGNGKNVYRIYDGNIFKHYTVHVETVGQFTGLYDKNGKRIFEGDIVKHYNHSDDGFDIGALYWDENFSQWKRTSIGNFHDRTFTYTMSRYCEYEVIGNIHDNPELLKGGGE